MLPMLYKCMSAFIMWVWIAVDNIILTGEQMEKDFQASRRNLHKETQRFMESLKTRLPHHGMIVGR